MIVKALEDKSALVTGAANGIGAAIAAAFCRAGARVVLVDRDEDGLRRVQASLAGDGPECIALACDVSKPGEIEACVKKALAAAGEIDILVNNAGGSGPTPALDIEEIEESTWDYVLDLNLKSTFLFSRFVVPGMRRKRYGRIINMSSTLKDGLAGPLNTINARLPYATSKGAIVSFTRQLAKDLAPCGITVNALAPGLIHADADARIARRYMSLDDAGRKSMMAAIPAGRPGSGEEVAGAALFLASPASGYITGDTLMISGGI
ncbi:3-oxoacyl-[acyl-carrier-protein] reductase FabG [Variovorax sp. WDL1]|nr:3-oxoacyl-[acyl-carrier protein] reductase [Variovorax sp. WDL1]PNG59211.1 3-oxoacyl-[acyl-carrier-protein] reductase FabG [Variovorax sp. B4]PNG60998.1 3-oxoacyl-[acyl-carrier-protein] reductase FabG [Variovorax sp. B2]VTV13065.1 3-oxoacyl-[acyl-carrier-protein] reductase FabG [Variovorax sp. WDL1]